MAEVDLLPEFNEAIAKSDKLAKSLKITADELDKLITVSGGVSEATKGNIDSFTKLSMEQKKLNEAEKEFIKLQDKVQKETTDTTTVLNKESKAKKDSADSTEKATKSNAKFSDSLQKLAPGLYGAAQGLMATTKAALAFIATPIGVVIALLAGAVLSITKYFQGSEEAQNKWNKVLAVGTQLLEWFYDILEAVGGFLVGTFEKGLEVGIKALDWFAEALTGNKKVISDYIDELSNSANRIAALEAQIDKNERNLIEKRAATNLRVAQLRRQADEENDPLKRRNLLVKAMQLEEDLTDISLKNAKNQVELAKLLVVKNGDDKEALKALSEARAHYADLQTKELEDTRKNNKERIKLDKELYDEQLALLKDSQAKQRAAREGYRELSKTDLKKTAKEEVKTTQDVNGLIQKGFEYLGIKKKEANKQTQDQIAKDQADAAQTAIMVATQATNAAYTIFSAYSDARIVKSEDELKRLEEQKQKELILAGDNEEAKAEIEKKFAAQSLEIEKRLAQEKRRAAIFDKGIAAIQAAISVTLAVIKAGIVTPLAIATGIAGAALVGAILAKPIPQYFKGTKDSEGGLAWIGEKGAELITEPSGKTWLSPSTPTLAALPAHSQVLTHEETLSAIARNGGRGIPQLGEQNGESAVTGKLDLLIQTVKNKKQFSLNITRDGVEMAMQNAQTRTWFLDNVYTTK